MGFADALGQKTTKLYQPRKQFLRDYEGYQHEDISRLRRPSPYAGRDLGFRPQVLEAKLGQGTRESAAAYKTDIGAIERSAAKPGGMRVGSGAYARGKQRAMQGHLGRQADIRTRTMIADAIQRRQDMSFRMGATGRAYGQGTGLYNAYQQNKAAQGSKWGKFTGGIMDAGVTAYTGGMMTG